MWKEKKISKTKFTDEKVFVQNSSVQNLAFPILGFLSTFVLMFANCKSTEQWKNGKGTRGHPYGIMKGD